MRPFAPLTLLVLFAALPGHAAPKAAPRPAPAKAGQPEGGLPRAAVGMVTDLAGRATVAGGKAVRLLDEVVPGAWVQLDKDARLVMVQLATGDELVFKGPCRLKFGVSGKPEGAAPAEVRRHPALGALKLRPGGMVQAALVMRGGSRELRLEVLPKGPVLLDPLPEFRWQALGLSAEYTLKVFDATGRLHLERSLAQPSLKLPADKALKAEEDYTWILEARVPNQAPRISTGRVRLLDAQRRADLEQSRPGAGSTFAERLVFAALLEELQVWDEAGPAWQALAKERPEDPRLRVLAAR
jgi:hypothetical protein